MYSPGIVQLGTLHSIIQSLLVIAQMHIANCPVEVCFGVVGVFLDGFAVLPAFQIVWAQCRWSSGRAIRRCRDARQFYAGYILLQLTSTAAPC